MDSGLVVVSGAPASGKTTLAVPLAAALGLPLIAADDLAETLSDALGCPPGDPAWSRRTGAAALELLWTIARRCPAAVLDADFRPAAAGRLRALGVPVVEVFCACPPEEALRRLRSRHPGRPDAPTLADLAAYAPLAVGRVIEVDTTRPPDLPALLAAIRSLTGPVDNAGPRSAVPRHDGPVSQHAYELPPAGGELGRLADEAAGGEVVYLTRDGHQIAAVVPTDVAAAGAEALEDADDERAAVEALAEWAADGYRTIPADQVWTEFDA